MSRQLAVLVLVSTALLGCRSWPEPPECGYQFVPSPMGPEPMRLVQADPWTCANAVAIEQALPEGAEPPDPAIEAYELPPQRHHEPVYVLDPALDAFFLPSQVEQLRRLLLEIAPEQPL